MASSHSKKVCRLCLKVILNKNFEIIDDLVGDILDILLLKLNFDEGSEDLLICSYCREKLNIALEFKSMCLNTDNTIIPYVDCEKMLPLDLKDVYKMENEGEQLTGITDDQKVCRLCMQLVRNGFRYIHEEEMASIQKFVPEMNISIIKNPIVCKQCFDSLNAHNSFLKSCFHVYRKIVTICDDVSATENQTNDELSVDFIKTECLDKGSEISEIEMTLKTEPVDIKSEENEGGSDTLLSSLNKQVPKNSNCKDVEKKWTICKTKRKNTSNKCNQSDFKRKRKGKSSQQCGNGKNKLKSKNHFIIPSRKFKNNRIVYKCDMCDYKTERHYFLQNHLLNHKKLSEVQTTSEATHKSIHLDRQPYLLVLFTNGVYYVCHKSEIKKQNGTTVSVFWNKKTCHEGRIIEEGSSKDFLLKRKAQEEQKISQPKQKISQPNQKENSEPHNLMDISNTNGECFQTNGEMSVNQEIDVMKKNNKKRSRYSYSSKGHSCFFCGKIVVKMARHLEFTHKNEPRVKEFTCLPSGDKTRKRLIDILRNEGDYNYNKLNESKPIVSRRIHNSKYDIIYCPICKASLRKHGFSGHTKRCVQDKNKYSARQLTVKRKALTMKVHPLANEILKEQILPTMRTDDVSNKILNDKLAIIYGNQQTLKYKDIHNHARIRTNLRLIARILTEATKISDKITDFFSCFDPCNFDIVILAINKVGRLDNTTGRYEAPDTAAALVTLLKYVARLLETQFIKEENGEERQKIQQFSKLLRTGLPSVICKTVSENKTTMHRETKTLLPTDEDIETVLNYSRNIALKSLENLQKQFCKNTWLEMAKALLVNLIVYNRRRPGETERFKILDYKETACPIEVADNESDHTSPSKKSKHFKRFSIREKSNKTVPLLIEDELEPCFNMLIENREAADVCPQNPFVFGIPSKPPSYKYLRGYSLLKKMADQICKHPERMKSTLLRKQLGFKCSKSIINHENKQDTLHQFSGDHSEIHETTNKQPEVTKDLNEVPLLLDAAAELPKTTQEESNDNLKEKMDLCTDTQTSSIIPKSSTAKNSNEKFNAALCDEDSSSGDSVYLPSSSSDTNSESESRAPRKETERIRFLDISLGPVKRRSWTSREKNAVQNYFREDFKSKILPNTEQCMAAIQECPELSNRTPKQLKSWIHNQLFTRTSKSLGKNTWKTSENEIIKKNFLSYIQNKQYPSSQEIRRVIKTYPELQHRTENMLRSHIQHAISKIKQGFNVEDIF